MTFGLKNLVRFAVVASFACALVLMLTVSAIPASAANLFVCQSCTAPPTTNTDPDLITNTASFNVGVAGSQATVVPLLIIVGVYNGSTSAPQISIGSTLYNPGGTAIYGWNGSASGFTFNASTGDACVAVGINAETSCNSEIFTNWNLGEAKYGIAAASSFKLYVYELPTGITGGTTIALNLEGGALGDYIIGYGCQISSPTQCSPNGNVNDTPFTTAGIDGQTPPRTPEPGTLVLFGTGMLGLAGLIRKRFTS